MKLNESLEKILRKWYFWVFILPVIIIGVISLILSSPLEVNIILVGFYLFPLYIIEGVTFLDGFFKLKMGPIIYVVIFYGLYIFFIVKVKKIKKIWLYIITLIIFFLAILGIKGCSTALGTLY